MHAASNNSNTPLDRWRRVAPRFTEVADAVPPERWSAPTPCDGWEARDIVRHLVDWVPPFLAAGAGVELAPGADVDVDPSGAWRSLADQLERLLVDHPTDRFSDPRAGDHSLAAAIDRFVTSDVLIHTWDLATATGQAVQLDEPIVVEAIAGMEPITDMLVASGHYGVRVAVGADADPTSRLIALTGRDPTWTPSH